MQRCPTCRARYTGKPVCHRCGTDFASILAVEERAREYRAAALDAFAQRDFPQMFRHAEQAWALRRTADAARLLACAALLTGKFGLAVSLRNRYISAD